MATGTICLTFDFDAVSLWISRALTTPGPISRGEFGATAVPRAPNESHGEASAPPQQKVAAASAGAAPGSRGPSAPPATPRAEQLGAIADCCSWHLLLAFKGVGARLE